MVKAIFFDVDGTLVSFETHTISAPTIAALHQLREKGILLFLSTGRHVSMLPHVQALFPFDGYITMSGQYCFAQDSVLRKLPIGTQGNRELISLLQQRNIPCIVLEGQDIYMNYADDAVYRFLEEANLPVPPVRDLTTIENQEIFQVITFVSPEEEQEIRPLLPSSDATRWHPDFFDIIPIGGGKHFGVDAICQHFDIDLADTMAFGDGGNDLTMLSHVPCGVAMGTASAEVRAAAQYVTGTVDEDGVVSALHHLGVL